MKDQIFISYSHCDSEYQLRLRKHLAVFERSGNIKYWSDTQLRTGDQWKNEIENNIEKTAVAILLISADFLASDFIRSNELPPLLNAWEKNGVHILPVIVKPCSFSHVEEINRFQAINSPDYTLEEMSPAEQERTWKDLAETAYARLLEYQETHISSETLSSDEYFPMDLSQINMNICYEEDMSEPNINSAPEVCNMAQEDYLLYYYVQNLLEHPEQIYSYYVYTYEHIDILHFLPKAQDYLKKYPGYSNLENKIHDLLLHSGWEGDGDLRLMWFPPFLKIGVEDTWGTLAWFVKQNNNGTSFIASPVPIPYLPNDFRILTPDASGFYTAQIAEVRQNINPNYRCFKLRGLLDAIPSYVAEESHWLLYPTGAFTDPTVNDWVKFRPKKICELRNFPDIRNTRSIYLYSLEILS